MNREAKIRGLEPRDLPELLELCREHAEYERASLSEDASGEKLGTLLLDSPTARCWVVEQDGSLLGFATVFREGSTWSVGHYLHLDCLFLRSEARGQGLGKRLLREAARHADEIGAVDLQWQTPEWNRRAIAFYRREGGSASAKLRFRLTAEACRRMAKGG